MRKLVFLTTAVLFWAATVLGTSHTLEDVLTVSPLVAVVVQWWVGFAFGYCAATLYRREFGRTE